MKNPVEGGAERGEQYSNLTEEVHELLELSSKIPPREGEFQDTKELIHRMAELMERADRPEAIDLAEDQGLTILQLDEGSSARFFVFNTDMEGYTFLGNAERHLTRKNAPAKVTDLENPNIKVDFRERQGRTLSPPTGHTKITKDVSNLTITNREVGFPIGGTVREIWHISDYEKEE